MQQRFYVVAGMLGFLGLTAQPLWAQDSLEADAQRLVELSLQDLIATPVVTASLSTLRMP